MTKTAGLSGYRFSSRTAWSRAATPLEKSRRASQRQRPDYIDLTCSNPTKQGFVYEDAALRGFFADAGLYDPTPLGLATARQAIARYLAGHGSTVAGDQIWLGAGTSELYGQLMTVLCDPGEVWLVPEPGYPLLTHLADAAAVRLEPYPLCHDGDWMVDVETMQETLRARPDIKAVVLVSPHNPTGHVVDEDTLSKVAEICARHHAALIVDEVFLDYPLIQSPPLPSAARAGPALTFTLSGLSKVAAFPQGKVSWAAVTGPPSSVAEALERLEVLADAYLSVSTVAQSGTAGLLGKAPEMQARIRQHIRNNYSQACQYFSDSVVSVLPVAAGWTVLLRLPAVLTDEEWATALLTSVAVMTYPGYLFGLNQHIGAPLLALSLLIEPDRFEVGCQRIRAAATRIVNEQEGGRTC